MMVNKLSIIFSRYFDKVFYDYTIEEVTNNFNSKTCEIGDIFFLDIDLKNENEIKIAERIRLKNYNLCICNERHGF